jgi:hypothetical protein
MVVDVGTMSWSFGGLEHEFYDFPYDVIWLVLWNHGIYDFPFSWECHHPN